MRLLHYYVTSACATFPMVEDRQIHDYWSITVPTMAFENECLLDAVLGATALHMSVRLPTDTKLAEVALRYQSSAISKLRHALSTVTAETAEPLIAAAIFTMLTTLTMSNITLTGEHYTPPARWFRIIYGMGCLIRHSQPLLRDNGIRLLQNKEYVLPTKGLLLSELPDLPDLGELLSRGDLTSDIQLDQDTKTSRLNFWNAVNQCLSSAVAGASRHLVRYRLLAIAATNDEHFMRLVEDQDLFAMIILSHYFALLEWCGGNWFLQHALKSQLLNLRAIVPPEYQWAMARPYCDEPRLNDHAVGFSDLLCY